MGKCAAAIGIGLTGAMVGMCAYSLMSTGDKCSVRGKAKEAVEDVKEMAGRFTEVD